MADRPRGRVRRLATQWPTLLLLSALWVVLWGDVSWANVLGGLVVAAAVVVLFPLPHVAAHATLRPLRFAVLVARFVADVFVASFQVAALALRPGSAPRGGVVGVRLRNPDDVFLTVVAEITSLVPGSVVVEARRRTGMLYLHVLDLDGAGGPDGVRARTLALEERVLRALGDETVLRRTGLAEGDDR